MTTFVDYPEDFTTVTICFTTHDGTGSPIAPSSAFETADFKIYKNGSATEKTSTNGLTIQSPHDSLTGVHVLIIDTSNDTGDGGFWVAGAVYDVLLSPDETVDGKSVAKWVGKFGLALANVLRPTTAGRTLDVSAGGEAGVDWANVGSPTTTLNLSGTTIATTQKVDVETIKTNPVVNGGTITFPTTATLASTTNITAGTVTTAANVTTVNGLAAGVITATSIASDAITAGKIADGAIDAATFAAGAIDASAIADNAIDAGAIASNAITAAKIADGAITANKIATDAIDADAIATDAVTEIQSGLSTLTAAGVRSAVGLASANLDTQLDALPTNAELATALAAADDAVLAAIAALVVPTANQNADALLDRSAGVETNRTLRQALRIMLAAMAGKASGLETTTAIYRDTNDSKDRITATVDTNGNRTSVTLDAS